jgi:hypothetical protein
MAVSPGDRKPHILVHGTARPEPYTYPMTVRGPSLDLPPRDRRAQSATRTTISTTTDPAAATSNTIRTQGTRNESRIAKITNSGAYELRKSRIRVKAFGIAPYLTTVPRR